MSESENSETEPSDDDVLDDPVYAEYIRRRIESLQGDLPEPNFKPTPEEMRIINTSLDD